jgi:hypothetical protein
VKIAKSMMASKVFSPPLRTIADVERWLVVLGAEIYMRIMDDYEERSRWPKTLTASEKLLVTKYPEKAILYCLCVRYISVRLGRAQVVLNRAPWSRGWM